jgi:hypothetical protein
VFGLLQILRNLLSVDTIIPYKMKAKQVKLKVSIKVLPYVQYRSTSL